MDILINLSILFALHCKYPIRKQSLEEMHALREQERYDREEKESNYGRPLEKADPQEAKERENIRQMYKKRRFAKWITQNIEFLTDELQKKDFRIPAHMMDEDMKEEIIMWLFTVNGQIGIVSAGIEETTGDIVGTHEW